jgi:hypothetical protein
LVIGQSEYIEDRPVPGPFPAFPMTKREKPWERGCFVLSGEYIQYSPLINFRLIIPSNIPLQLIIPSNIHNLCSTKNEKKTTSRRQFGIENYFYSEPLTQPRNVKNKYVILWHLGDMCLFTSALRASVNKSHIPSLPQNNLYIYHAFVEQ